jgi:hypothetical protein
MSMPAYREKADPWSALRRFAQPRAVPRPCELCSAPMEAGHGHLLEPATRLVLCCCDACAILFDGRPDARYRRIPRRGARLTRFQLSDARWESLHLPINMAFFARSGADGRVVAFYPSPAGATESLLPLGAWEELEHENPVLREFEPDVEALLINRVGATREYFRAPIDECYKLVGVIRTHWRGLGGGAEVWEEIARFFDELRDRSDGRRGECHA